MHLVVMRVAPRAMVSGLCPMMLLFVTIPRAASHRCLDVVVIGLSIMVSFLLTMMLNIMVRFVVSPLT